MIFYVEVILGESVFYVRTPIWIRIGFVSCLSSRLIIVKFTRMRGVVWIVSWGMIWLVGSVLRLVWLVVWGVMGVESVWFVQMEFCLIVGFAMLRISVVLITVWLVVFRMELQFVYNVTKDTLLGTRLLLTNANKIKPIAIFMTY